MDKGLATAAQVPQGFKQLVTFLEIHLKHSISGFMSEHMPCISRLREVGHYMCTNAMIG